ncbi:MAG TPA: tetraacyldisaccharide 4'-kinase [Capsulimonadaceae bacterium]|jgi:tetraacyldisaccharide 4'-kinase
MVADEKYWRDVLSGNRRGLKYTAIRGALLFLEALYAAGLSIYLWFEKVGIRPRTELDVTVISIGNLAVGGTGKTPATQWLAKQLLRHGYRPAILNRGHGGSLSPQVALVSDRGGHVKFAAAEAGDEAVMLATNLPGIPVVVGKDRRNSGRLAIDEMAANVLVLDDGFQYWQLARDLDIVLLDASQPFDNGHALPRGFLREPKSGLRRAGVVLVTRSGRLTSGERSALSRTIAELAPDASVFFAAHKASGIAPQNEAARAHIAQRLLPVCGIAQPGSFTSALHEAAGCAVAETLAFPDHQPYGDGERESILRRLAESNSDGVITTEKDAVKFPAGYLDVPVYTLRIAMAIDDEALFWETVKLRAGLADMRND